MYSWYGGDLRPDRNFAGSSYISVGSRDHKIRIAWLHHSGDRAGDRSGRIRTDGILWHEPATFV